MLLFLFILLIILCIIALIVLSEIRVEIKNFEYSTISMATKEHGEIRVKLYFLGKLKWLSIKIQNNKLKQRINKNVIKNNIMKIKEKNKLLSKSQRKQANKVITGTIVGLIKKFKIKELNLKILLDSKNVILTSYLVGIISIILSNLIRKNINEKNLTKYNYKILPLYENKNTFYIKLNCILSIKIVHIINMLINTKIWKGEKWNERTSYRRFNVNCNGKYKKYDRC